MDLHLVGVMILEYMIKLTKILVLMQVLDIHTFIKIIFTVINNHGKDFQVQLYLTNLR